MGFSSSAILGELRMNTSVASQPLNPGVTGLATGGFVVGWTSFPGDGNIAGILGTTYGGSGPLAAPIRIEAVLNPTVTGAQTAVELIGLAAGGYMAFWDSTGQDGSGSGIYGQRYNDAGNAVGLEFRVNTTTAGNQAAAASVQMSNGSFLVTWESDGQDGSSGGIFAQRFSVNGVAQGAEFQVNSFTTGNQYEPDVAALSGGGSVAVWTSDGQDGSQTGVYAQILRPVGTPLGAEFRVNDVTNLAQGQAAVAGLPDGSFVIAWSSFGQAPDSSVNGVYLQRYSAIGVQIGAETLVNTTTVLNQNAPSVATLEDGGYVVVWRSDQQDGSGTGIYGQRFDAAGLAVGAEFRVNTTTVANQNEVTVAALAGGGFVVSWASDDAANSSAFIFTQVYEGELQGTAAADIFAGQAYADRVDGRFGVDILTGNAGADILFGGGDNDELYGGSENDVLDGGSSNDRLTGSSGADQLLGAGGRDSLFGGAGDDTLSGGDGNDIMVGSFGADQLDGGLGSDIWRYLSTADSTAGLLDVIASFGSDGVDRIDLVGIDADTADLADDAFVFVGAGPLLAAGDLQVTLQGADSIVRADVDGNGIADLAILVLGATLTAASFLF